MLHYENLQLSEISIKTKKIHCILEINQSQWVKPYNKFNTQERIEAMYKCMKISMNILVKIDKRLISVINQQSKNIIIIQTN